MKFYTDDEKKPRKVSSVPTGYVLDTAFKDNNFPNRKYYKRETSSKTSINGSKPASKNPVVSATRKANAINKVNAILSNSDIDRVYLEPEEVPATSTNTVTNSPAKAFEGNNIFMRKGLSNVAIGQAKYPSRKSATTSDGGMLDTGNQDVQFQYYTPGTGSLDGNTINIPFDAWNNRGTTANFADTSFINKYKPKMGLGGDVATSVAPTVFNSIMALLEGNKEYSAQPIINTSTARAMVSPYAWGGTIDDLTDEELTQLQADADQQGISVEEAFDAANQQYYDSEDNGEEYAKGGWIKKAINPAHKGYCTPMTKSTCTGHRRALAKRFKKGGDLHKAMGGNINAEVEGGEVVQAPGQPAVKVSGPKHEQGGVDIKAPAGTKVYSDRLKLDGKTMQKRKLEREKAIAKLTNLSAKSPRNILLKNTIERTQEGLAMEDEQDIALQDAASKIYADRQKFPTGGRIDIPRPWWETGDSLETPPLGYTDTPTDYHVAATLFDPDSSITGEGLLGFGPSYSGRRAIGTANPSKGTTGYTPTTGDYVGMAGTAFNAIAPILNSNAAARATKPTINRYKGVGQRAIDNARQAQSFNANMQADELTDIDTTINTQMASNRNNASSINTLRALDTATTMAKNKAKSEARSNYFNRVMKLLDEESRATNIQDVYEAQGQTQADTADVANVDNYFTNRGSNLVNVGNSIQTVGKNLNVSKSNSANMKLLSQLSQYGLAIDEDGNLINI